MTGRRTWLSARRAEGFIDVAGLEAAHPAPAAPPAVPEEPPSAEPSAETLTVVSEGTDGGAVAGLVAGVAVTAVAIFIVAESLGLIRSAEDVFWTLGLTGVASAALAFLTRRLLRYRHELTVGPEGISLWRSNPDAPENGWTRIPWTDIAHFHARAEDSRALLNVISGDRRYLHFLETPPRPEALELVRRFQQEAARHPRSELLPADERGGDPIITVRSLPYAGITALLVGGSFFRPRWLHVSFAAYLAMAAASALLFAGVRLWIRLDDSDVAYADRAGRSRAARFRQRLRRWFGIRHV